MSSHSTHFAVCAEIFFFFFSAISKTVFMLNIYTELNYYLTSIAYSADVAMKMMINEVTVA